MQQHVFIYIQIMWQILANHSKKDESYATSFDLKTPHSKLHWAYE
jgi:hypothetical protein